MSESSAPHTVNVPNSFRFDSAGKTLQGCKTKIENPDNEKQGEICLYGRNIFMGYLSKPNQTNEAIDANGWLHSGDVGKIDKDGFLYITGRIKVHGLAFNAQPSLHIKKMAFLPLIILYFFRNCS